MLLVALHAAAAADGDRSGLADGPTDSPALGLAVSV
jgi:hypothetical protein